MLLKSKSGNLSEDKLVARYNLNEESRNNLEIKKFISGINEERLEYHRNSEQKW